MNRSGVEEIEFDHSHISGGISKINTADNVFGIFTSRAMREKGKYQLQLMKTRSSSGIGQKIELDFNVETLRISDPNEDGDLQETTATQTPKQIMAATVIDVSDAPEIEPPVKHVVADVQGSKLRAMLNNLKANK